MLRLFERISILAAVVMTTGSAIAATHVINFGGALGLTYSPAQISVNVGDTIQWIGDFSSHPLLSTSVPSGAASFGTVNTGSTFSYVVTQPGPYAYKCQFHGSIGMAGTITAVAAGVSTITDNSASVSQNFPNPVTGNAPTMIHFVLEKPEFVTLKLYDERGTEVQTLLNEHEDAGMHMVTLDPKQLASGTYTYILSTPAGVLRKNMVVLR